MDVPTADVEVFTISDSMVREASLPDWKFRGETMGKAALYQANRSLDCGVLWR